MKLIGNLLEKLKSVDWKEFSVTCEPLDQLEEALRKAIDLVESCKEELPVTPRHGMECRVSISLNSG